MNDWTFCDGNGGLRTRASRRGVLAAGGAALLAWAGRRTALADVAFSSNERRHDTLVVVFLRGGADGLNVVVPHGEAAYYRARPTLAIAAPRDGRAAAGARAIDLDGFFGLHPKLAPLQDVWHTGRMAVAHAVGSGDGSRSHFEAMSTMERGAEKGGGPADGWIARHLATTVGADDSPLRAVAFGATMPDSLRGATHAVALESLADFRLVGEAGYHAALGALYAPGRSEVAAVGRRTLSVLDALGRLDPKAYRPQHGAAYPDSELGAGLRQVACLVRGNVGLEVACLDKGGWDTHVAQGADTGWQASLLDDLGRSVAAFAADLGPEMDRVTLVVMSEFGRRVAENQGLGTDHGRAGAMFVVGGSAKGGKVHGRWPGLEPSQLDEVGDLRVATDYRAILAEVLEKRMGNVNVGRVFPELGRERLQMVQT